MFFLLLLSSKTRFMREFARDSLSISRDHLRHTVNGSLSDQSISLNEKNMKTRIDKWDYLCVMEDLSRELYETFSCEFFSARIRVRKLCVG